MLLKCDHTAALWAQRRNDCEFAEMAEMTANSESPFILNLCILWKSPNYSVNYLKMTNVNKSFLIAVWSADSHEEITGNLLIISPATNAFVSQTSALIYTVLCSLICKTLERSFSETVCLS